MVSEQYRTDGFLDLVLAGLKERGLTVDDLDVFLDELGIPPHSCLETYLEVIGQPDDIRSIAEFLGLPASHLMEQFPFTKDELPKTVFDESWPNYRHHLKLTPEEAWHIVVDNVEFRGQPTGRIRERVNLVLDGLIPPRQYMNARVTH